jgi:hypothetical protein
MKVRENLKERNDVKVIEAVTSEWLDRIYGNSYFVSVVTLFGSGSVVLRKFVIPFEYGYGSHSETVIAQSLGFDSSWHLFEYAKEKDIHISLHKKENCLRRDLRATEKYTVEV